MITKAWTGKSNSKRRGYGNDDEGKADRETGRKEDGRKLKLTSKQDPELAHNKGVKKKMEKEMT